MNQSLYERIGGHEAIFATVNAFYDRIMGDERLRPFFEHLDMERQVDKQVAFLTMALGGPSKYTGRDLRTAHAPLVKKGLGDSHFDAVATHLRDTLEELSVPEELIGEVLDIVAATRKDVLGG